MSYVYHHVSVIRVIDGDSVVPKKGGFRWRPTGDMNPAFKGGLVADKGWFVEQYTNQKKSLRDVSKLAGRHSHCR